MAAEPGTGRDRRRRLGLWLGPALAVAVALLCARAGLAAPAARCAGVAVLCAVFWITEALPIPVTSLIPFVAFPLLGVLDHEKAVAPLGDDLIVLLLGGFLLSKGVEKSLLHRRIAFVLVHTFHGLGRRGLVLGFMVATAACSMWISNTATVLVLLPVVLAVLEEDRDRTLRLPLLLGIAYAASIGGLGTKIGTPPNLVFIKEYERITGHEVDFVQWMAWGLPIVVLFLPIAWLWLTRGMQRGPLPELPVLGPATAAERRVGWIFATTALLWILRSHPAGGWPTWLGLPPGAVGDETVALLGVLAMFLVPDGRGARLLDWETARTIPWGLLLLFAGGIGLARGFSESGLSAAIGDQLAAMKDWNHVLLIFAIALTVTFLTEITSNTATTVLLMPILGSAAVGAGIEPRILMVPAVLSASFAFMLPVATAPNAIVFGTDRVGIEEMAREGLALNLFGAVLTTALVAVLA
ncbi:MAG: SLC13 family permease [Planctomycetota bacterium]